jgi:SRSO17 transposase
MERRFEVRMRAVLAECEVPPQVFHGWQERLREFAWPFLVRLVRQEQIDHAGRYLTGLVSGLESKNVESIAYLHDQERRQLQAFVGQSPWDHRPLLEELARQVGQELGEPDGVLVFDPSGFPKSGRNSVGVARQWCGRLGKVDNCQVAVYLGYVSRREHALVDMRLYLPADWARDRVRRRTCGVPSWVRFRTRHELALEMLSQKRSLLPHAWVAGDDEMGRSTWFRRKLTGLREQYLLAVPSNTTIRDLQAPPPSLTLPRRKPAFEQVHFWATALSAAAWTQIDVRDGHRGPLVVEAVKTRVVAKTDRRRVGPEETLVVLRTREDDGSRKYDYYLSNAPVETPLAEFARVAKAEHRIEEGFQRGKSEAGLADYEVRTWVGWYHHQTLSLIATWFLVQEARRGKKIHAGSDGPTGPCGPLEVDRSDVRRLQRRTYRPRLHPTTTPHPTGPLVSLEISQLVGAIDD